MDVQPPTAPIPQAQERRSKLRGWFDKFTQHATLPVALGLAVFAALSLTVLSVWLYSSTGANRLDLSRPGYERERQEVRQSEPQRVYDTTSPVTPAAIDDFLNEYDGRVTELNNLSGFSNQAALDDRNLQLSDPKANASN